MRSSGGCILKGPLLAKWLYPEEVRPYCDSDLMVAPDDRARAVKVLERLGFAEHCAWMPTPLSLIQGHGVQPSGQRDGRPSLPAAGGSRATRMRSGVASRPALSGR